MTSNNFESNLDAQTAANELDAMIARFDNFNGAMREKERLLRDLLRKAIGCEALPWTAEPGVPSKDRFVRFYLEHMFDNGLVGGDTEYTVVRLRVGFLLVAFPLDMSPDLKADLMLHMVAANHALLTERLGNAVYENALLPLDEQSIASDVCVAMQRLGCWLKEGANPPTEARILQALTDRQVSAARALVPTGDRPLRDQRRKQLAVWLYLHNGFTSAN